MSRAKLLFKSLKARLQTLRLKWGKRLLDRPPPPAPSDRIRSILFLRHDGKIGDAVVSSFVFREIKQARPDITTAVICTPALLPLYADNPHIDEIQTVRTRRLMDYLRAGRRWRKRFDAVIDPTAQLRNRDLLLLHLLHAPHNIGLDKHGWQRFNINIPDTAQPMREVYRAALRHCGIDNADCRARLPTATPQQAARIAAFVAQHGLHGCTALNFFGAARHKHFSPATISRYLAYFCHTFPQRRFLVLAHPAVRPALLPLCAAHPSVFVDTDSQTIAEAAELIRHADTVISPDTAIVHIAAALNKNIIAFYRDDDHTIARWSPQSAGQVCILRYRERIDEITPEHFHARCPQWYAEHPTA